MKRSPPDSGLWLGILFSIAFVTGLASHLLQHPTGWFVWPTRPVNLYRFTQGLHVIAGTAAVPVLIAKLYTVYPRLFAWPPFASIGHALERLSVLVLVGAAFFELISGLLNIAHWYPWAFYFPTAHYAVAYVAVGSIAVHVAVKLPVIRRALGRPIPPSLAPAPEPLDEAAPTRRAFLASVAVAVGAVFLATAGSTIPFLRKISVLAVRDGEGPQGVPVNKPAAAARVVNSAQDPAFRVTVIGPAGTSDLSLTDLQTMPQHTYSLPIACVEGWSASAVWTGVRIADLVAAVGGSAQHDVRFVSLEQGSHYSVSVLPARHARDPQSLLALRLHGEVLDLDHGYPCRLIAPSRPGVLQTKWVSRIEVLT